MSYPLRRQRVGQDLPPEEESVYEKDVLAAKARELDAWSQCKVYSPMESGRCNKEVVGPFGFWPGRWRGEQKLLRLTE